MKLTTFLRRFVDGRCPSAKLPATLNLTGIRRTMKQLWNASVRNIASGVVLEHAATLAFSAEGKARLIYPVDGTADDVEARGQEGKRAKEGVREGVSQASHAVERIAIRRFVVGELTLGRQCRQCRQF